MSETMEQLASALGCEVSPEPLPVKQFTDKCPVHGFRYISYPREANDTDDLGFVAKCCIRTCYNGILKPRAND